MAYLTILYLLHATGMSFLLLAVTGAVQVAPKARGKSLPAELCLVVAHTSRLSVIGRKSVMLILLFDGAFGVFSDGFHLVSARVRMEINDHRAHVDTNISSLPQT